MPAPDINLSIGGCRVLARIVPPAAVSAHSSDPLAAPALKDTRNNATFYVTVGFLGKRGYMSPAQLRELGALGFEIGCHSMTHPYLSDLSDDKLHQEIAIAKIKLEQITGRPVE